MIVFVIGPSKAGKTETTKYLAGNAARYGMLKPVVRVDLDEALGAANRGFGEKAVQYCETVVDNPNTVVLIDVGAGQLVSLEFQRYLGQVSNRALVVAINCGRATFCERHGANAPNEVSRYYGDGSLEPIWLNAAIAKCHVDSSGAYAPERWAYSLAAVISAG